MEPVDQSELLFETLQNASKHIRAKQFSQALDLYQEGLANTHASNHRMQGILLSLRGYSKSSLGNDTGALADYELALGKDPLHTASLVRRGVSFMKLGRYEEACESFKRGMILEPDNKTIASFIEELDTKIYEMKESDARVKYPLKKKISEIMYNVEEEDEDIFLNFSNLKDIDKQSCRQSRTVLFRFTKDIIEVQHPECPEDDPAPLPKYNKEEIVEIEKQLDAELDPKSLHDSIIHQDVVTPIVGADKPSPRKSILRQSQRNSVNEVIELPELPELKPTRRISALSVKDIDGKVIRPSSAKSNQSEKHIMFGYVLDDAATPTLHSRMTKSVNYSRKSSIRLAGTVLQRKSESIKFCRKDSSFSNKLNIDGKLLKKESENIASSSSRSVSESKSEKSNKSSKSNKSGRQLERCGGSAIQPKLMRKESILRKVGTPLLKPKRSVVFYEEKEEPNEQCKDQPQVEVNKESE